MLQKFYLFIISATPTVTTNQLYININLSDSVTLNCQVTAVPLLKEVKWSKKFGDTFQPVSLGQLTGGPVTSHSLVFSNIQMTDAGIYICSATNALGEALSQEVNVTVSYSKYIHKRQQTI